MSTHFPLAPILQFVKLETWGKKTGYVLSGIARLLNWFNSSSVLSPVAVESTENGVTDLT